MRTRRFATRKDLIGWLLRRKQYHRLQSPSAQFSFTQTTGKQKVNGRNEEV
jgi:hypothetical protein